MYSVLLTQGRHAEHLCLVIAPDVDDLDSPHMKVAAGPPALRCPGNFLRQHFSISACCAAGGGRIAARLRSNGEWGASFRHEVR